MALLPFSPVTAVVDENNLVRLTWQPPQLNGNWDDYGSWTILTTDPSNPSAIPTAISSAATGLETQTDPNSGTSVSGTKDVRQYLFTAAPGANGALGLSMGVQAAPGSLYTPQSPASPEAWANLAGSVFRGFPSTYSSSTDNKAQVLSLGQPLQVFLGAPNDPSSPAGQRWMVTYSDGTSSEWMPISLNSTAKAFQRPTPTGGFDSLTITVENRDVTDNASQTPVILRRSVTLQVFVLNQQFKDSAATGGFDISNAQVGIGGLSGFEITDNSGATQTLLPFLAFMQAIVQDDQTNELKLLVATTRNQSASSLLGTMAADVFPLLGRPVALGNIEFPDLTMVGNGTLADNSPIVLNILSPLITVVIGHPLGWSQNWSSSIQQIATGQSQNSYASGGKPPYRWFATELPEGLSLTQDGLLFGTPTALGFSTFNVSVQDSQTPPSQAETSLSVNVISDLTIPAQVLPNAQVGVAYNTSGFQLQASGGIPPFTWSLSGTLPVGMSISSTGLITGTPTTLNSTSDFTPSGSTSTSPYAFMVQATDAVGAVAAAAQVLNLAPMTFTIEPPDQPWVVAGQQSKLRFPVVGGVPPYTPTSLIATSNPSNFITSFALVNGVIELLVNPAQGTTNAQLHLSLSDAKGATVTLDRSFVVKAPAITTQPIFWAQANLPAAVQPGGTAQAIIPSILTGGQTVGPLLGPALVTNATATAKPSGEIDIGPTCTTAKNVEVTFKALIQQGSLKLGVMSREYSILTVFTNATNGVKFWTTEVYPCCVGDWLAFDPQCPTFNPAPPPFPMTAASGLRMRIQPGSALPIGISLDATSGLLYGAVVVVPTYDSILELLDGTGVVKAQITVHWNVYLANTLGVAPVTVPDGALGVPYSLTFQITGATGNLNIAPPVHGSLPAGLSVSAPTGTGTVVISGLPQEAGYYDIWLQVTDSAASPHAALIYFRIWLDYAPELNMVTDTLNSATVVMPFSQTLTARGGSGGYVWTSVGTGINALPSWLTLSSAGVLASTGNAPNATSTQNLILKVTDSNGNTDQKTMVFTVVQPSALAISVNFPQGTALDAYPPTQIQVSGGVPPYSYSASGLPANLTCNSNTGVVSGIATGSGSSNVTVTVTDQRGVPTGQASQTFPLQILDPGALQITLPGGLPTGTKNSPFSATLGAIGGTQPYTFAQDPNNPLPAGLSLNASTGVISGSPAASTGASPLTVGFTVTDSSTIQQTSPVQTWPLTVMNPSALTWITQSSDAPAGFLNEPYNNGNGFQLQATTSNGQPVRYTISPNTQLGNAGTGTIVGGVTVNAGGLISGTTVSTQLNGPVTFRATGWDPVAKAWDPTAVADLIVNMSFTGQIIPNPTTLPTGFLGQTAYSVTLTPSGGLAPYTFALAAGSLPAGLGLSGSTISGSIPSSGTSGNYSFTILITDGNGTTLHQPYTITIGKTSIVTNPASLVWTANQNLAFSQAVTLSGGAGQPYSSTLSSGALPAGITLSSTGTGFALTSNGATVTAPAGVYNFVITVADSIGATVQVPGQITITAATYSWTSRVAYNQTAWTESNYNATNGIPIGVVWSGVRAVPGYSPLSGGYGGSAFVVRIDGLFNTAAPTLAIAGSPGNTSWSCSLISAPTPGVNSFAEFSVNPSGVPSGSGSLTLQATLTDKTVTTSANLLVFCKSGGAFPGGSNFRDGSGTALSLSTYSN